jgi:hypothetical protein
MKGVVATICALIFVLAVAQGSVAPAEYRILDVETDKCTTIVTGRIAGVDG